MYKALRNYTPCKWVKDQTYELNENEALESIEAGLLEAIPVDEEELKFQRAIERYKAEQAPREAAQVTAVATAAIKAVMDGMQFNDSSRGPIHVKVIADEDEKTKGMGEFLQCVGLLGVQNADPTIKQAAGETLQRVYKSHANADFAKRWAESQAKTGQMSLKAALAEASGITGGYTVPTEYAMELLSFEPENNVIAGYTDEYAMTGRELRMPVLDQTTASGVAGQTSYFGGVVAYWTAEAALRQETEPKFREITLVANELSGYALASREVLFDNKVALEQRLTRLFGGAVGWYRDYAYLQGNAVGMPRGIFGAGATLTVSRASGGHIAYADAAKMVGKLMSQSWKTAYWVMQQSVLQDFLQMADSQGRYVVQPYYPQYVPGKVGGPATVAPIMTLLGFPIKVTEKVPALGSAGDLSLIDPKGYFTSTRRDIEIAASEHYKFLNNQVTYRFIFRGDGEPWMNAPFTMQDQTTQVSPFVKLV